MESLIPINFNIGSDGSLIFLRIKQDIKTDLDHSKKRPKHSEDLQSAEVSFKVFMDPDTTIFWFIAETKYEHEDGTSEIKSSGLQHLFPKTIWRYVKT